jgi:hypothetical protein
MAEYIGRPLFPNENVHHKNGRRAQNDIGNLELWVKSQPTGQRPLDLLAWARQIEVTYAPDEGRLRELEVIQAELVEAIAQVFPRGVDDEDTTLKGDGKMEGYTSEETEELAQLADAQALRLIKAGAPQSEISKAVQHVASFVPGYGD